MVVLRLAEIVYTVIRKSVVQLEIDWYREQHISMVTRTTAPPNTVFQPTRCASLALQDRRHFDTSTDLLLLSHAASG
jgi:hypothetical protein